MSEGQWVHSGHADTCPILFTVQFQSALKGRKAHGETEAQSFDPGPPRHLNAVFSLKTRVRHFSDIFHGVTLSQLLKVTKDNGRKVVQKTACKFSAIHPRIRIFYPKYDQAGGSTEGLQEPLTSQCILSPRRIKTIRRKVQCKLLPMVCLLEGAEPICFCGASPRA